MKITEENIWNLAGNGKVEILNHPLVDKVKTSDEATPLHWLAKSGRVEVLNHPSVDQVKNNLGWTPLHILAWNGKVEVLNHPSVDQVKDSDGETPLHFLARSGEVTKDYLKEKYPWFDVKGRKIDTYLITEILDTPNSIRFMKE